MTDAVCRAESRLRHPCASPALASILYGETLGVVLRRGPDTEALLADLQGGLDALHSLLSEIDAREQQLELETLRSILSQLDKREQERQTVSS